MDPQIARSRNCVSVDEVLITNELFLRPHRDPDYEAQSKAMDELGNLLTNRGVGILQKVSDLAMNLCHAHSAGISILEEDGIVPQFRWHALTGKFAHNLFGTIPRDTSPCGVVIARDEVLLFNQPERSFAELQGVEPRVYEALLSPWYFRGIPRGTLWVLAHTPELHFDSEDARIVQALARFAAAAYQMVLEIEEALSSQLEMERRVREEAHLLSNAYSNLRQEMELRQFAQQTRDMAEEALRESESRAEKAQLETAVSQRMQDSLEHISWMLYDAEYATSRNDAARLLSKARQEISRVSEIKEATSNRQR